jgi:hypothetical protein
MMLAWAQYGPDGTFAGSIADPMPLHVDAVGQLRVDLT